MNSSASASAVLGLFLLLQLVGFLALLLGGLYLLNCLGRMVSSLERLADAAEERLVRANVVAAPPAPTQLAPTQSAPTAPATIPTNAAPANAAPPVSAAPPMISPPPRDFPVVSGSERNAPSESPAPASSTKPTDTVSHEEAPR